MILGHINVLLLVERNVLILVVVFVCDFKASIRMNGYHLTTSLVAVSVDAAVSEVVDGLAVRQCNALILKYKVIEVIMTVEHTLRATKLYHCIEKLSPCF